MRRFVASLILSTVLLASSTPILIAAPVEPQASPGRLWLKGAGRISDTGALSDPQYAVGTQADAISDAVALPPSPVAGSLASQGASDLYAVDLAAGERVEVSLPAAAGSFDLYLYPPGSTGPLTGVSAVAHASEGPAPRAFIYDVSVAVAGTYYIEVYAWSGSGSYTLDWLVRPASERARIDVPAATPLAMPATRALIIPDTLQANYLYLVTAAAGSRITASLAGPVDADFDLYLYSPGTTSILPVTAQPVAWSDRKTANEQITFDVPAGLGGTYILEVIRFSGSGNAALTVTNTTTPAAPTAVRVSGPDRFSTAAEIAKKAFPAGNRSAILCSGLSFPDGLAASSLAGVLDCPILLTKQSDLPDASATALEQLGVTSVYVIGGTAVINSAVLIELADTVPGVKITRIAGANRYETAGKVADKVRALLGVRSTRVFLASGEKFPDALALSPIAYSTHMPILLTNTASLSSATSAAIARMRGALPIDVVVAGGVAAVSATTASQAKLAAGGTLTRAAGADRMETALAVAELAVAKGWVDPGYVAICYGYNFPDALGGAPLPGNRAGVLLLSPGNTVGPNVTLYMKSFDFAMRQCWALGGTAVVADATLTQVKSLLPKTPIGY